MKRIAWGITGSGDQIVETYHVMRDIKEKTDIEFMVFLSKEGEVVMKWYRMWDDIQRDFPNFKTDAGPNSPFIAGPLQVGHYDALIIAPATANSVAKMVHGIADTFMREGRYGRAWQWHLKSLMGYKGWRYLPYSRRLLTLPTKRI